ncbi:MAG: hypothetical protein M1838_003335 [Thelocarpon superellum]|nr:MAG: hypothetical protein M1838_003335 [Thelocarpon superellum]
MRFEKFIPWLLAVVPTLACDDCYGPRKEVFPTRSVRRMQPGAQPATSQPRGPLAWGQLNFLHTTDTHGWLEGHLKEPNYGADWGDFVSFSRHMKQMASQYGVDLLLVDTGDLHDGAGLSDATTPNGVMSNVIFENVDYDLLTIGNHELYVTEIAYETFSNFSKVYGDRYLTSNVQILNPASGHYEYIGQQYRYFTTAHGLRIMSFGVLYDFTGNSNVSRITHAADLVKQDWFLRAINYPAPIDVFVVLGHNPARSGDSGSTFETIFQTIRGLRPDVPIQIFGGHTHVRDFVVFDDKTTGIESGRYCETLGWVSISGINSSTYTGKTEPYGVPNPSQPARVVGSSSSTVSTISTISSPAPSAAPHSQNPSSLLYSRRYLDWNRRTFEYHASGSQDFDIPSGVNVTGDITADRLALNLSTLYGCAPDTYCLSCEPFGAPGSIFSLLEKALAATVINASRASMPRLIIVNTGSVRFDLVKGPFTYDDSFIVSPFTDGFQFLPNVSYSHAAQVLGILNRGPYEKRDPSLHARHIHDSAHEIYMSPSLPDLCRDPNMTHEGLRARSFGTARPKRRESTDRTPGYTTTDDFGTDGDDTIHSAIPDYDVPNNLQANASFPNSTSISSSGGPPGSVDLIFLDFIAPNVVSALNSLGGNFSLADSSYYLPPSFTTNSYLPAYAKLAWQDGVPNCPVGDGVGSVARSGGVGNW